MDRWYERGFNQSGHLSKIASRSLGFPVFRHIYRFWSGEHQSRISKNERLARYFSFWIPASVTVPDEIILVDDVISTGSTLRACARCLISKGCKKISIVALARSS